MLPHSLIADCSSSPRSPWPLVPGRLSIRSDSRRAVGRGNTSSVRPVRSPSMFMSTAATGSSGPEICGGTSSRRAMLIVGTLIMIVLPVICESAVAAWPAPMFATSRNASSWIAFNERMSSISGPLEKTAHIDDQGRRAVAKNRGAGEQVEPAAHSVELLHHDFLLTGELVDHHGHLFIPQLDHDRLLGVLVTDRPANPWQADDVAEPHQWHDDFAEDEHRFALQRRDVRTIQRD